MPHCCTEERLSSPLRQASRNVSQTSNEKLKDLKWRISGPKILCSEDVEKNHE